MIRYENPGEHIQTVALVEFPPVQIKFGFEPVQVELHPPRFLSSQVSTPATRPSPHIVLQTNPAC